jgi:hypothetical protein
MLKKTVQLTQNYALMKVFHWNTNVKLFYAHVSVHQKMSRGLNVFNGSGIKYFNSCIPFFRSIQEEGHRWYCFINTLNIAPNYFTCVLSCTERSVVDKIIFFRWSTNTPFALWILQMEKESAVSLSSTDMNTIHRGQKLEIIRKFYRRSLDTQY